MFIWILDFYLDFGILFLSCISYVNDYLWKRTDDWKLKKQVNKSKEICGNIQ